MGNPLIVALLSLHLKSGISLVFFLIIFIILQEMLEHFHTHYLRRWLIRDSYQFVEDEEILLTYRKLAYK